MSKLVHHIRTQLAACMEAEWENIVGHEAPKIFLSGTLTFMSHGFKYTNYSNCCITTKTGKIEWVCTCMHKLQTLFQNNCYCISIRTYHAFFFYVYSSEWTRKLTRSVICVHAYDVHVLQLQCVYMRAHRSRNGVGAAPWLLHCIYSRVAPCHCANLWGNPCST